MLATESTAECETPKSNEDRRVLDCSVVALTHYLPPYMARVLYHTAKHIREFKVLLSIAQEPNRQFDLHWEDLDVRIQKSWMFCKAWKHRSGFTDELYVHLPYDTLSQLRRARPDIGKNGWIYNPHQPAELHAKLDTFYALKDAELAQLRSFAQRSVAHITSASAADQALAMFRTLCKR